MAALVPGRHSICMYDMYIRKGEPKNKTKKQTIFSGTKKKRSLFASSILGHSLYCTTRLWGILAPQQTYQKNGVSLNNAA